MVKRKITMQQLYRIARRDRRFFDAIVKNPRTAIAKKGLSLSPGDLRRLERTLRKVYKIRGKDLAGLLRKGEVSIHPWPAKMKPWPAFSNRPWP